MLNFWLVYCKGESFFRIANYNSNILNTDDLNQANVQLINLKEIIDNLQSERNYFKTQVAKLQYEKKHLNNTIKNLSIKVNCLEDELKLNCTL